MSDRSRARRKSPGRRPAYLTNNRERCNPLLSALGLANVSGDPLLDLVAAHAQRMVEEGRGPRTRRRYVVWGEVAS